MRIVKGLIRLICGIIGIILERIANILSFLSGGFYIITAIFSVYCICHKQWIPLWICAGSAVVIFVFLFIAFWISDVLKRV